MVQLSALPRLARYLLGLTLLLTLGGELALARLPHAERVPANALAVVGVADTAGLWQKLDRLPLAMGLEQYLNSPELASDTDYQQFLVEKGKLEQTLGYPVTAEELLGHVFKDLLVYSAPGDAGKPEVVVLLGVRDKAKAAKLIQALDKRNAEQASLTADTATSASAGSAFTFEKTTLSGTQVSHYRVSGAEDGEAREGYYALAGDRLIFTDSRAGIGTLLAPAAAATSALAANTEFTRLTGLIPWNNAAFQGWVDGDAIAQAGPMGSLLKNVPTVGKSSKVAFTCEVLADGLLGKVASSEDPTKNAPNVKPGKLASLPLAPPSPMLAISYGLLAPEVAYQNLNNLLAMAAASGKLGEQGPDASPLASFERETGISVQNELVPALGQEVGLTLNSVMINPLQSPPLAVDLAVALEVRDAAKMKAIMTKLEKTIETRAGQGQTTPANPQNPAGGAGKFQTVTGGPVPIRTFALEGIPGLSPSYAFQGKFLLVSLSPATLQSALNRTTGKEPSLASTPVFTELQRVAGNDPIYSFTVVDVSKVVGGLALPFLSGQLAQSNQQQLLQLLTLVGQRVGTVAAAETIKDGAAVGLLRVKMQ